jgi:hypothetical protein
LMGTLHTGAQLLSDSRRSIQDRGGRQAVCPSPAPAAPPHSALRSALCCRPLFEALV